MESLQARIADLEKLNRDLEKLNHQLQRNVQEANTSVDPEINAKQAEILDLKSQIEDLKSALATKDLQNTRIKTAMAKAIVDLTKRVRELSSGPKIQPGVVHEQAEYDTSIDLIIDGLVSTTLTDDQGLQKLLAL